jgi:hypothetical protein
MGGSFRAKSFTRERFENESQPGLKDRRKSRTHTGMRIMKADKRTWNVIEKTRENGTEISVIVTPPANETALV